MGGKYIQDTTKNRIIYQNCGCCHTIMKQNANWVKKIKSMAKLFWMIFCDFFSNLRVFTCMFNRFNLVNILLLTKI